MKRLLPSILWKTGFGSAAVMLCFLLAAAQMESTNFTGVWSINQAKSKLGEARFRMLAEKLNVSQNGNVLSVERVGKRPDGETYSISEKITLDGKESTNNLFEGVDKKSVANWSADGKSLTIASTVLFNRDGNEMKINSTEVWDFSSGPQALTIQYASSSPNMGEIKDTYVYEKEAEAKK